LATDLGVNFVGIKFKNPVLVAPGPPSSSIDNVRRAVEAGCGGVIVKTVVSDSLAKMRRQPRPRFHLLDWDGKLGSSKNFTLYSVDQGFPGTVEDYRNMLEEMTKKFTVPIIGSLMATVPEEWVILAQKLVNTGVVGLELDLSCPHTVEPGVYKHLANIVEAVASSINLPIIAKLPLRPDLLEIVNAVMQAGAQGVTLCNRTQGLDIDIESAMPLAPGSLAGHGGPWSKYAVLAQIVQVYKNLKVPISGTGGINSDVDALKYFLAGAQTVQICSGLIINGYELIGKIVKGIETYLDRRGYSSLQDIVGIAAVKVLDVGEIRRGGSSHARIDETKCNSCGRCIKICFHRAISQESGHYKVLPELCSGCGLCVQRGVCPQRAIDF